MRLVKKNIRNVKALASFTHYRFEEMFSKSKKMIYFNCVLYSRL